MNRHDLAPRRPVTVAAWFLAALVSAVALPGCPPRVEPPQIIAPRETLIANYNARAEAIPSLRAKCRIEARLTKLDGNGKPIKGKVETYSLDGSLRLRKPRDLYLVGRAISQEVFGLHSNAERYWWWVDVGEPVEYVGRHGGPGADLFPVRPDLLLEALAIYPLSPDMRVFKRGDRYDIIQVQGVELQRAGSGDAVDVLPYIVQEVSLDRTENHDPVEVRIYDKDGDPLLISTLGKYEVVDGQRVPTEVVYRFVPIDWTFTLHLSDVRISLGAIKDAAFEYRPKGFDRTIDLDAEALIRGAKPQKK